MSVSVLEPPEVPAVSATLAVLQPLCDQLIPQLCKPLGNTAVPLGIDFDTPPHSRALRICSLKHSALNKWVAEHENNDPSTVVDSITRRIVRVRTLLAYLHTTGSSIDRREFRIVAPRTVAGLPALQREIILSGFRVPVVIIGNVPHGDPFSVLREEATFCNLNARKAAVRALGIMSRAAAKHGLTEDQFHKAIRSDYAPFMAPVPGTQAGWGVATDWIWAVGIIDDIVGSPQEHALSNWVSRSVRWLSSDGNTDKFLLSVSSRIQRHAHG